MLSGFLTGCGGDSASAAQRNLIDRNVAVADTLQFNVKCKSENLLKASLKRAASVPGDKSVSQEITSFNTIYQDETERSLEVTFDIDFDGPSSLWAEMYEMELNECKMQLDQLPEPTSVIFHHAITNVKLTFYLKVKRNYRLVLLGTESVNYSITFDNVDVEPIAY